MLWRVASKIISKLSMMRKYSGVFGIVPTLSEAAQYFNIGERKLQQIADENRDTGFVIYNGVKLLFKREKFSEWLNETNAI